MQGCQTGISQRENVKKNKQRETTLRTIAKGKSTKDDSIREVG